MKIKDKSSYYRDILNQYIGKKQQVLHQQKEINKRIETLKSEQKYISRSKDIILRTAEEVQNKLSYHIDTIVNMTLKTVFANPYIFRLKFISKAGKTEAVCEFTSPENGNVVTDILEECGGGVADIASFGLRLAMLKLAKQRQVLLLDEPFKNLSAQYVDKASTLLKKVADCGVQIILNTHIDKLIEKGDKVFRVSRSKGVSTITEV